MKAKKWLIIITGAISFLSIMCAFWFDYIKNQFFMNFSFAIMGSAILGGIMSLTEYFVTKKQALEQYYLASYDILKRIEKVKYFFADEPIDLIIEFFHEKRNIETEKMLGMDISTTAREKLFSYMIDKWKKTIDIPEPEFSSYAKERFDDQMQNYIKDATEVMESYVRVSKIDLRPLDNAYGELDFLFANQSLKNKIFKQIHQRLWDYKCAVAEQSFHFNLFLTGGDNLAVMLRKIEELQKMYFTKDVKSIRCFDNIIIHAQFAESMDESIEELRCKIYGQKYEKPDHVPVAAYQILRKIEVPEIKMKKENSFC